MPRDGSLPTGYGHVHRAVTVGAGQAAFEQAVDGLFGWEMHRGVRLAVTRSGAKAAPGGVVVLQSGWGPLRLMIPCRVVYTVNEADRRGFAYGTLPGHRNRARKPSSSRRRTRARSTSTSAHSARPASLLAPGGGPLTRIIQEYASDRYVKAMQRISQQDIGS
jgi:uncharacterized protein (UPF0548 family)